MLQQKSLSRCKHQKTRSGCFSCKKRRVKCDEGKPACLRCVRLLIQCEGYAPEFVARTSHLQILRPAPSILHTPDIYISTDPEERRYFYLFCQDTADILSGHFYSSFWSKLVPQSGRESKPIHHGVAAVTALLKLLEPSSRSPLRIDSSTQKDQMYHFFMRQYIQAVKSLRDLLATEGSHHNVALIACIIFTSIETLQGDLVAAGKHIFSAFSMAAEAIASKQNNGSRRSPLDDGLVDTLLGLEYQSKLPAFYTAGPQSSTLKTLSTTIVLSAPSIPTCFRTIDSAKKSLDSIMHFISYYHVQRPEMLEGHKAASRKHLALLKEWEVAFIASELTPLAGATHSKDSKNQNAYLILASTHALALVIVKSDAARCSEMFYDTLQPHFQCIIDCSKEIIHAMPSDPPPSFVFEVGILPPLHITAMKCRIPSLRREAIALLRAFPGQEGVWEGFGCAEACEWMMEIEESGIARDPVALSSAGDSSLIPEWDRVRLTSMVCWLNESKIWAQCTSVLPIASGADQVWEKTFTW